MNSTNSPETMEQPRGFNRKMLIYGFLLITGILVAIIIAFKLGFAPDPEETEPPPIIIKSGSFNLETDTLLANPNNDLQNYTRYFGGMGIKAIRVTTFNEKKKGSDDDNYFAGENSEWKKNERVEVNIEVDVCEQPPVNGLCPNWSLPKMIRIYDTENSDLDGNQDKGFNLKTSIPISSGEPNFKEKRQYIHKDTVKNFIRFSKVSIRNATTNKLINEYPKSNSSSQGKDKQEYVIAFYYQYD